MSKIIRDGEYLNMPYVISNPDGNLTLMNNDLVIVHPTETSISKQSYIGVLKHKGSYLLYLYGLQPEYNGFNAIVNEYSYKRLELVSWWREYNSVNSPPFKAMAKLLGIGTTNDSILRGMPGYTEPTFTGEPIVPREFKVTLPKSVLMRHGMEVHLPEQHILIN